MEEVIYKIYSKIGEFFTGTERRRWFYFWVLVGLNITLWFNFFIKFKIEADSMYWIFSSIVQSLLALTAFMGVVVIFKYQSISSRGDRLMEEMNKGNSDLAILGGRLDSISIDELLKRIKKTIPEEVTDNDGYRTRRLREIARELETYIFNKNHLGNDMIKIVIYSFFVVLLSFICLSITPYLAKITVLSIIVLYSLIYLVADILRLVIKMIASVVFQIEK